MKSILNIAAYLFVSLNDLQDLRAKMLEQCNTRNLKGTILLTGEGINMFLAGGAEELRGFLDWLRTDPRFKPLEAKESWSEDQPFKKMLIKLKNEIIRMNHPAIRPEEGRANFISPKKLQEWLDRGTDDLGRPVVMVDTRNAFEVDYGTFENALHFNIEKFKWTPKIIGISLAVVGVLGRRCNRTLRSGYDMAHRGYHDVLPWLPVILPGWQSRGWRSSHRRC